MTILATAAQHQVTSGRVSHCGYGRGLLLTSLGWSSRRLVVSDVSVRSKPVLVKRVFHWSQRIVLGCVPTICCQLVSQHSHHHTHSHVHILRTYVIVPLDTQLGMMVKASSGREGARRGGQEAPSTGRARLLPSLRFIREIVVAVPASSESALAPVLATCLPR